MATYSPSKITKDGNTYNFTDTTKIPLAGTNALAGSIIPSIDNSYDLGDSTYGFASFYVNKLYLKGSTIFNLVDDSFICVAGATAQANGANLVLNGKDRSTSTGEFKLEARDGTNTRQLIGKPDGTLTWNGSAIVPSTDNGCDLGSTNYQFNAIYAESIQKRHSSDSFYINNNKGAYIILNGSQRQNEPGVFKINAYNGTNRKTMNGYPNGTWTWDGTACQITSDQRYKQQIAEIDDKLLDAWEDVTLVQFKYNDAVEQKGKEKARLHTGYVVQQINEACQKHDIDISEYGLYCHEEYLEETGEVEVEQKDGTKKKERKVIREASEHYSLRYTEALIVECAYLRKCIKELRNEIEELKKGKEAEK